MRLFFNFLCYKVGLKREVSEPVLIVLTSINTIIPYIFFYSNVYIHIIIINKHIVNIEHYSITKKTVIN